MKVNCLKRNSRNFPDYLTNIPSPPKQIYIAGADFGSWIDSPKVAIVGSRKATSYGRLVTEKLSSDLARQGIVIISGLALGIDSFAHKGALDVNGVTVAVLPTALDRIYPASHNNLARQILTTGGALISEYPPGSVAYKQNFIARNRIVSALADVLVIAEAAVNSGSLHTANFALEQGKTVMAVPGNINSPGSEGANNLIKSGAVPVTSAEDVIFALGFKPKTKLEKTFRGSADEKKVLATIQSGIGSQDEIAASLKISAAELNRLLTTLELSGYIKPKGGGYWNAS